MRRVTFVFFDAGGGHRAAVSALTAVIAQQQRPWDVRLLNLQELLDKVDPFLKLTGLRLQDFYNRMIERGWTLGTPQLLPGLHGLIRLYHPLIVRRVARYWSENPTDMVVSLIPNFNRALAVSVKRGLPGAPFVTILTDLADYPPHFWMERESEYLICGSDRAVEQARALGHAANRIFRVAGMILNPRFYETAAVDRAAGRAALGLEPERPTGMILFGGQGSRVMGEIVRRLDGSDLEIQLIAICGHNAKLKENLEGVRARIPLHVEGFTREVPRFMALSDFFIGKPGPASLSEALHMSLPVMVERNAWTLPQERCNAEWVEASGVGVVLRSFREVAEGVARLLDPARGKQFRANAASIVTNAVFEIPGVLEQILDRHP